MLLLIFWVHSLSRTVIEKYGFIVKLLRIQVYWETAVGLTDDCNYSDWQRAIDY